MLLPSIQAPELGLRAVRYGYITVRVYGFRFARWALKFQDSYRRHVLNRTGG